MQKLACYTLALLVITLFMIPQSGYTTGLGLYLPSWGNGTSTINYDNGYEWEQDIDHIGIGFVLDTRVARRGVFNYRLHLGFESAQYGEMDNKYSRFALDNTFGFAIVQSSVVRLWFGPQIRLVYQSYSESDLSYDASINALGIGLAPVLGFNFNLGNVVSICPEIGFRFMFLGGTQEYDGYYGYSEEPFDSKEQYVFVNLALLFRINDVFDDFF